MQSGFCNWPLMLGLMILRHTHLAALSIILKLLKFDRNPYSQPTAILPPWLLEELLGWSPCLQASPMAVKVIVSIPPTCGS